MNNSLFDYILLVPLLVLLMYLASFAKYQWSKKNRLAAAGIAILGIAAAAFPVYLFFFGYYDIWQ